MPDDAILRTVEKPRHGNTKVTREDWLQAARNVLVHQGVGEVKILALATELGVARSSFYAYFADRADLKAALLAEWEARNTRCIVEKCNQPKESIGDALCGFFECFIDPTLFDQGLDFAVREWSRRDVKVRAKIDAADHQRLAALTGVFVRHGFDDEEADARARIVYFMQLGYHALEVKEPMEVRMSRLRPYLKGFTGEEPSEAEIAAFQRRAMALEAGT
ncbi:MAG: TetR/AcrR family transcriptional regulator [Pseudomonadota bacterium]